MDRRLLQYYDRELPYIREMGGEFAKEHPKIAGRLSLDEFNCADPYVERLLEGFAFLSARVQLKLDAEFPRFTQSILETIYPHYLSPTPSMAVVQFKPEMAENSLVAGFDIPVGTSLRSLLGKDELTACEYRTAHDVKLWPLEIVEAQYHTRDLATLGIQGAAFNAKAGIRIRLQVNGGKTFKDIKLDRLAIHLFGAGDRPMRLYEQIIGRTKTVVAQGVARPAGWQEVITDSPVAQMGFGPSQQLLPYGPRSFQGYRLAREYFTFPQRFLFVELCGLKPVFQRATGNQMDLIFLVEQADLALENVIDASNFLLYCAPAINLFPRQADRIHLTNRFSEYQVIPDRTRTLDYEVYQVLSVTAIGDRAGDEQEFLPFYSAKDVDADGAGQGAYYAVNRVPRMASQQEQLRGRRSSYPGSEVYLSLVDAKAAPYRTDLSQLSVRVLCTNRDLPLMMPIGRGRTDFSMEKNAPVQAIRCVGTPTPPLPSYAEGEVAWRAISHLSLNYLSLTDADEHKGAAALRDILRLYAEVSDPQIRKQIEGIRSVSNKPITRRVATPGPIAFARGLEVTVEFDDAAFEGTGVFVLGAVLEQFFAKYVSLNSFTETVIRTVDRGEIMRWPARVGQRQLL